MKKISLNTLVESFSESFGRVTEILSDAKHFIVTYPYTGNERMYSFEDVENGLIKIHAE
jgi:hypothetical protein